MIGVNLFGFTRESNSSKTVNVVYDTIPVDLQFFGRDNEDSAAITVSGKVLSLDYDTAVVKIFREGDLFKRSVQALSYSSNEASFSISPKIHCDTVSYDIEVCFAQDDMLELHSSVVNVVCGDVIIVHGQSNAWANDYDDLATYQSNWIRTLGRTAYWNQPPPPDADDDTWYIAQGHTVNTQAAIGVYALELARTLVEDHGVPICIFNGSGGGGAIYHYQRSDTDPEDLNTVYGRLLYRVKKAHLSEQVKIITWDQGESEANDGYLTYADDFGELYDDLKDDFPNVERVYLFQIPPGCLSNINADRLRETQRLIPEQYDDLEIMSRSGLPGHDYDYCHYHYAGYAVKAYWTYRQISRDFYDINWSYNVNPPMILKCGYMSENRVALVFDQAVQVTDDTTVLGTTYYLKDHIYLDGQSGKIDMLYASGDSVILEISSDEPVSTITYTPNKYYNNSYKTYEGPWIRGAENSVGALTFYEFPLQRINLDLKVFLEGPFVDAEMSTLLNTNGILPLTQPYAPEPWNYSGPEYVDAIPNADVVDWVLVELRDALQADLATNESVIARQAGFLLKDGTVTGIDGESKLEFNRLHKDNLFVAVMHRNHLGVISTSPLTPSNGTYDYNFTNAENKALGGKAGHKEITGGIWGLMSSDGNGNGQVNNADKNGSWIKQYGSAGYLPGDFNMDGIIDDSDKINLWESNGGSSSKIPGNSLPE